VLGDTLACLNIYQAGLSHTVFGLSKHILEVVVWHESRRTIMGCGVRGFVCSNEVFGSEVGRSDTMLLAWIS
jgi:hypothetical protein